MQTLVDRVQDLASDKIWLRYLTTGEVTGPIVEVTYDGLAKRAREIATLLQQHASPGDRALLLFPSGAEFLTTFFGCLFAGVIAVPAFPPDLAKPERAIAKLRGIAQSSGARLALTTSQFLPMLEGVAPNLAEGITCLATDVASDDDAWKRPAALDGDTVAMLQYTSGSTGAPKGVILRHRNFIAQGHSIAHGMGDVGTVVGWLPVFHDMGLIGNVLQVLHARSSLVLMSPEAFLKRPMRWLAAISHFKGVASGGPNFAYDLCVRRATDEPIDLSSWAVAFCGAEPIREATYKRFCERFEPSGFRPTSFYPCYGLAEATLFVSGNERGTPIKTCVHEGRTLVSSGRPSPTEEVRIVDPDATTGVGEIWVSGPAIASGYWEREDDCFQPPMLRTGDRGFVRDGELYIAGRSKDMIILGGRNLFPPDIESTIEIAVPSVRKGCCAAFSVEKDGEEKLVVVSEINDGEETDIVREMKRAVLESHQAAIFEVVLVEKGSIPKTSSGKLERYACRNAYQSGALIYRTRA